MNKTRKPYSCPELHVMIVKTHLMSTSTSIQATVNDETIINYRGIDTDGTMTPGSRRHDIWDEEEE